MLSRSLSISFLAAILGCSGAVSVAQADDATYNLTEAQTENSLDRVVIEIDTKGQLKLNAESKQVTYLPLVVKAKHEFDERLLASQNAARMARHFREARAAMRIGETDTVAELAADHRLIVMEPQADGFQLTSPLGPLSREELDLLETPADSLALSGLLPPSAVKEGDAWQPASKALAKFLRIDAVVQNDIKCTLRAVDKKLARIEFGGKVDGSIEGIATRFELAGKLQFNRESQKVTWLGLAMKEDRAIGHAAPGFEVGTTLKIARSALDQAPELSDEALANLPPAPGPAATLLKFETQKANFRLLHDRNWRVMVDRPDSAVLRFVHQGDLIAQCNVTQLPNLAPGKSMALETFQDDVKASLGKGFEQFTEATSSTTSTGLKIHRVVAVGMASQLPIQWIYLHVTGADGRRAAVAITVERKFIERFAGADQSLVGTFEFLAKPNTPAEAKETASKQATKTDSASQVGPASAADQARQESSSRR